MALLRDEIKAAMIIAGSVLVLSVLIVLIGGTKLFARHDTYYTKVSNAAGLEVGAQVRLGGVRAGKVIDIVAPLKPGELVTIVIGVNEGTPIYNGTTTHIAQIGFVGDIYLLLSVGSTTAGLIEPGPTLPSVEPVEFAELLQGLDRISGAVEDLIKDIDLMFSEKNLANIESLIANTNTAISNASASLGIVALGLRDTTDKMKDVLHEVEIFVREGRGDLSAVLEKAAHDLDTAEGMILAVEDAAKKIGNATDTVEGTVGRQDKNLDELMGNLTRTLRDLQDVLQALKLKPWSVIHKEKTSKED